MTLAHRIAGAVAAVGWLLVLSCSSSPPQLRSGGLDPAINLFLAGEYDEAIETITALLETPVSNETRLEAYYYLGRAYLEMGDVRAATDAFVTGVQLGDDGPCREYLEKILPSIEGTSNSVRRMLGVPRSQLAALVMGWLAADPTGARAHDGAHDTDPLSVAAERGWMPAMADGSLHHEAFVTRAAFHVFVSRMCMDFDCARPVAEVLGRYPRSDELMSGVEILSTLDQLIPWKFPDGG